MEASVVYGKGEDREKGGRRESLRSLLALRAGRALLGGSLCFSDCAFLSWGVSPIR